MKEFLDRVLTNNVTGSGAANCTWTASVYQYALPPLGIDREVPYTILDADGLNWEVGRARLYESGGTYTLERGGAQEVHDSSNAGSAISLSSSSTHTIFLAQGAYELEASVFPRIVNATSTAGLLTTPMEPRRVYRVQLTESVDDWQLPVTQDSVANNAALTTVIFTAPDVGGPYSVAIPNPVDSDWYQLGALSVIELGEGDAPIVCTVMRVDSIVFYTASQSIASVI